MKRLSDFEHQVSKLILKGFKSISDCNVELGSLNILIGPNGAGKSNFVEFFKMIRQLLDGKLQLYVGKQGGPDALLHFGRKKTEQLEAQLFFGNNGYQFTLEPTRDNRFMFADEAFREHMGEPQSLGSGHFESKCENGTGTAINRHIRPTMLQWRVYHFHDTGESSYIKQRHAINDNVFLRPDGRNLAAYLYLLKQSHPSDYRKIVHTIRLVAPFFDDFFLRPQPDNRDTIELEWTQKGEDVPFKSFHLSDGTLRFICLAVVLLQPGANQPATILVDEPELGLHPYAITVLASLVKSAARRKQIILSTQSVELVSEFDPEDLVVVDSRGGKSLFSRPDADKLKEWLKEYSLGELWKKNLFGGRP